jgi:hypothetical protein
MLLGNDSKSRLIVKGWTLNCRTTSCSRHPVLSIPIALFRSFSEIRGRFLFSLLNFLQSLSGFRAHACSKWHSCGCLLSNCTQSVWNANAWRHVAYIVLWKYLWLNFFGSACLKNMLNISAILRQYACWIYFQILCINSKNECMVIFQTSTKFDSFLANYTWSCGTCMLYRVVHEHSCPPLHVLNFFLPNVTELS